MELGRVKRWKRNEAYFDFIHWLEDKGYSEKTIGGYMAGARLFAEGGYELSKSGAKAFRQDIADNEWSEYKKQKYYAGARVYVKYKTGDMEEKPTPYKKGSRKCNFDCFNCQYPDCIRA